MMRYKPGFVLKKITLGMGNGNVTVEDVGSDMHKVTLDLSEYVLNQIERSASTALEQAAKQFESLAKSLRELAETIEKDR